jgi:asparaginyl-tRNA synthetase
MGSRFFIKDIARFDGQIVTIQGWLYNLRSSGKILFAIVRDGSGFIQCVATKTDLGEDVFETTKKINLESSIEVIGKVRQDDRSPWGYEIDMQKIRVIQSSEEYPIALKDHGVAFLSNIRHLWLRSPKQHAILKIRATVENGIREFLNLNGFILVDSPILTGSAPEGTTSLFELDYFGEKAYLSQTGQLYQEATAMAFGRTYCFGPTFRAEKSKTRRHLTEFWMVEPEMAYCEFEENLQIQEGLINFLVCKTLNECERELKVLERDITKLKLITSPFPRITYREVLDLLNKNGRDKKWGDDITGLDETIISNEFEKPVFITHFPVESKAFYMKPDPTNSKVVLAADLMAPEGYGEIIGGSQRIDDLSFLIQRIQDFGLSEEAYQWYIDLRRYGSVPHSGFGMGLERFTGWMAGIEHIREASPFPRTIEKIYP